MCRTALFTDVQRDGVSVLKVCNENRGGSRVVGVFNTQGSYWCMQRRAFVEKPEKSVHLRGTVVPKDADCPVGWNYMAHSAKTNRLSKGVAEYDLPTTRTWDIITFAPILRVGQSSYCAVIGMPNYLNCGGVVEVVTCGKLKNVPGNVPRKESGVRSSAQIGKDVLSFQLLPGASGQLVLWSTMSPNAVEINGKRVTKTQQKEAGGFRIEVPVDTGAQGAVVEISWS